MKTSIYLPDDLAEQVKVNGISISEVAQAALRDAIEAAEQLRRAEKIVVTDLDQAARRLAALVAEERRIEEARRAEGYAFGVAWAKERATLRELRAVAQQDYLPRTLPSGHSLTDFAEAHPEELGRYVSGRHVFVDSDRPFWTGLFKGAADVWTAVQPILERQLPS